MLWEYLQSERQQRHHLGGPSHGTVVRGGGQCWSWARWQRKGLSEPPAVLLTWAPLAPVPRVSGFEVGVFPCVTLTRGSLLPFSACPKGANDF